ncbi:MAG: class I SAM-dependent methyltransferase [Verrucomicrobiales bacterium]|jgi:ubiquinone/menaquinone biosynthesis C-methylase UbiE/uncharacterized protein YbaR (Trm112 family)
MSSHHSDAQWFVSPDSREPVKAVQSGSQQYNYCSSAKRIYPIIDDIPILLSDIDRCYELEYDFVAAIISDDEAVKDAISRTLEVLENRKGQKSWAWEDAEHWAEAYSDEAESEEVEPGKWVDRDIQRIEALSHIPLQERPMNIVDIGCGNGHTFRTLVSPHLHRDSFYLAIDISLEGLKLNRSLNLWKNALYVVASADHLPIADQSADFISYYGILHHTEFKAENISRQAGLLKDNGFVLLAEGLTRARILPDSFREDESAHEERIPLKEIEDELKASNLQKVFWKEFLSVFYSGCRRLLGDRLMSMPSVYNGVMKMDGLLIRVFGRVIPYLRPGEVIGVLKKAS